MAVTGTLVAAADECVPQTAEERVLHLWVDPHYGDDGLAAGQGPYTTLSMNPDGSNTIRLFAPGGGLCQPTGTRPNDIRDPNQSNAVLLHAPHPFRTITAAVDYINRTPRGFQTTPLPYTSSTMPQIDWAYAIIHLLPGLYRADSVNQHLDNGLVGNGETFPIRLPSRVSIQGTSALNTLFELDHMHTAFEFGVLDPVWGSPIDGQGTFISNVTIYSGGNLLTGGADGTKLAAILIDEFVESQPTITNCVFVGNHVAVLVNVPASGNNNTQVPAVRHDGVTLINNTFVWNGFGVWNGQDAHTLGAVGYGWSKLNLINNILESGYGLMSGFCFTNRPASWPGGVNSQSAFEGIPAQDMRLAPGGMADDYNAYEWNGVGAGEPYNTNFTTAALPITLIRQGLPGPMPAAGRNIYLLTGFINRTTSIPRGILYVRDLMCNGRTSPNAQFQASNPLFDGSPLDFRLSPWVAPAMATPLAPNAPNPLVDNGWGGSFPVTMANGNVIQHPPGFLPLTSQSTWAFDNWTFDCEGYANPRIYDHPNYANQGTGLPIDIGADELGDLIVAGYRFGTTAFIEADTGGPLQPLSFDNRYQWYLGPANTPVHPTFSQRQPDYRAYSFSTSVDWPGSYVDGLTGVVLYMAWHSAELTGTRPWRFTLMPPPLPPLTSFRNLYRATTADVTPHLLPDIHPWWSGGPQVSFIPPALTLWQPCLDNPSLGIVGNYNRSLYVDPITNVINPPGSYRGLPTDPSYAWLDGENFLGMGMPPIFAEFNNWEVTGTPPQVRYLKITHFDLWCRGVENIPPAPVIPAGGEHRLPKTVIPNPPGETEPAGLRFSLEWAGLGPFGGTLGQNLQSFMVLVQHQ